MKATATRRSKALAPPAGKQQLHANQKTGPARGKKARVLIEFPTALLQRADAAARKLETNRSGVIRTAVEDFLQGMEAESFTRDLAAGYAANAEMARALAKEFDAVDREGF